MCNFGYYMPGYFVGDILTTIGGVLMRTYLQFPFYKYIYILYIFPRPKKTNQINLDTIDENG
jgi:hypothetical protein